MSTEYSTWWGNGSMGKEPNRLVINSIPPSAENVWANWRLSHIVLARCWIGFLPLLRYLNISRSQESMREEDLRMKRKLSSFLLLLFQWQRVHQILYDEGNKPSLALHHSDLELLNEISSLHYLIKILTWIKDDQCRYTHNFFFENSITSIGRNKFIESSTNYSISEMTGMDNERNNKDDN